MKIRTITFHRAQNHGSVLQAYALQEFVKNCCEETEIDCDYKIIDFIPEAQNELYAIFRKHGGVKSFVKNSINLLHYKSLAVRQRRFKQFIDDYLDTTEVYIGRDSLNCYTEMADLYISGSDQIWNVRACDSSPAYFYDFLPVSAKRISYAASFGPLKIDWSKYDSALYSQLLDRYSEISVREQGSADNIAKLTGKNPKILPDPTLLLSKEMWKKVASAEATEKKPYILLYALEPTKVQLKLTKKISEIYGSEVIVLRYNNKNDWFNTFEHRYDAGPCEFLSYILNAELIVTTSFHGTAFSINFEKPFWVIDGLNDARIGAILKSCNLECRNLNPLDMPPRKFDIDFSIAREYLAGCRKQARDFMSQLIYKK